MKPEVQHHDHVDPLSSTRPPPRDDSQGPARRRGQNPVVPPLASYHENVTCHGMPMMTSEVGRLIGVVGVMEIQDHQAEWW